MLTGSVSRRLRCRGVPADTRLDAQLPYRLAASVVDVDSLDRMAEFRSDPARVASLWEMPDTRVVVVRGGRAVVGDEGLRRLPVDQAPEGQAMLLGVAPSGPLFVLHPDETLPHARTRSIRSAAALLGPDDLGILLHAVALTGWHENHPRCPRCGEPTVVVHAGYARRCPRDGSEHYPRTDPAVIVLVVDEPPGAPSRCLLGRQAVWPVGRFSTLAGFVEPGETVEAAVAREVAEEVGVKVDRLGYAGSQPWPFPASLMLAYYAVAAEGAADELSVDGEEIAEARWFTRDELRRATDDQEVLVPPRLSVARRLIEGWLGEPIPGHGTWR